MHRTGSAMDKGRMVKSQQAQMLDGARGSRLALSQEQRSWHCRTWEKGVSHTRRQLVWPLQRPNSVSTLWTSCGGLALWATGLGAVVEPGSHWET